MAQVLSAVAHSGDSPGISGYVMLRQVPEPVAKASIGRPAPMQVVRGRAGTEPQQDDRDLLPKGHAARPCSDFLLRDLFRLAQAFTDLLAMLDERMPDRADSRVMVKAACGGFCKGNIAFQIFIAQRPVGVQE